MQTALTIFGLIGLLIFSVDLLLVAWGYLVECRTRAQWDHDRLIERETIRNLGVTLVSQCYWFSESDEAMLTLQALGEFLRDTGDFRVSNVRDEWRRKVAQPVVTR